MASPRASFAEKPRWNRCWNCEIRDLRIQMLADFSASTLRSVDTVRTLRQRLRPHGRAGEVESPVVHLHTRRAGRGEMLEIPTLATLATTMGK